MSSVWVVLGYGLSVALALFLLYYVHLRSWFWHISSVVLALIIGLIPNPFGWTRPAVDLLIGALFVFLVVWGLGEFAFHSETHHHHHHHRPHHA